MGLCRVLDNSRYYSLCSEKKVVDYIEGMTTDADKGTDNLLRSMLPPDWMDVCVVVERETRLELATTCLEGRDSTN